MNGRARFVGLTAIVFSFIYVLSEVIEVVHGGFSTTQLWLTLIAEAAVPIFVIGFALVQRSRRFGFLGDLCALGYAYSYLYFTGTVVYALVNHTPNYETLADQMGPAMTVHGAVMVFSGIGLAWALFRSGVVYSWACAALALGVVLVVLAQTLPEGAQLLSAGIRALGFVGIGLSLLRHTFERPAVPVAQPSEGAHAGIGAHSHAG